MRSVRVFLSSTFADFQWERELVNTDVLPALNRELLSLGARIDLIDLRWGVSEEAGLDHATTDICLREVERCCSRDTKPAFVLLMGDRGGWRPLPRVILDDEFMALVEALEGVDPSAAEAARRWYVRDRNHVPDAWSLRSRRGTAEVDPVLWAQTEAHILGAADACADRLPDRLREALREPMTRKEAKLALALERSDWSMIAAMHRVVQETGGGGMPPRLLPEAWSDFADDFADHLIVLDYDPHDAADYQERFRAWIYDILKQAALAGPSSAFDEQADKASIAFVKRDCGEVMQQWLVSAASGTKLLYGASGSGKSTLVRQITDKARGDVVIRLAESETVIGVDDFLLLLEQALGLEDRPGLDRAGRIDRLRALLSEPQDGFVLVVDAIEQIRCQDASETLAWLPQVTGSGRHILLTTASVDIAARYAMIFGDDAMWRLHEMSDVESIAQLDALLAKRGRRLQDRQRGAYIAATQGLEGRALVNLLAAGLAARTHSDADVAALPKTLAGWIGAWIHELVDGRGQGEPLLLECLALIVASRKALPEQSLAAVLDASPAVRDWFRAAFPHAPEIDGLPRTTLSCLIAEIDDLLDIDIVEGALHYRFLHDLLRAGLSSFLPPTSLRSAREALAQHYIDLIETLPDVSAAGHALSEVVYQHVLLGGAAPDALQGLFLNLDFLAAKTAPERLTETMEEIALLREVDWLRSDILLEWGAVLVQERAHLATMSDQAVRRDYLAQIVAMMLPSSVLKQRVVLDSDGGLFRARFLQPKLPGLAAIGDTDFGMLSLVLRQDDEIILTAHDGSIAIVGHSMGEVRRRLPGHPIVGASRVAVTGVALSDRRLLTCGVDGTVAVSSTGAGRILWQASAGGAKLHQVAATASGMVVAASADENKLFRWSADGMAMGAIPVSDAGTRILTLTVDGAVVSQASEQSYISQAPVRFKQKLPRYDGFFQPLDDDHIVMGNGAALAVWSFSDGRPRILLDQSPAPEMVARHVVPCERGMLVVTKAGAIFRLSLDGSEASVIHPPGIEGWGGADVIDDDQLFCWSLMALDRIRVAILDRKNGDMSWSGELTTEHAGQLEYFRSGTSSVYRGICAMDGFLCGWSGYGCDRIDLDGGVVTPMERWPRGQLVNAACRVSGHEILMVRNGRPLVFDTDEGKVTRDFHPFTGRLQDVVALGDDRVLAIADDGGYCWNLRDSIAWYDRQDFVALGRQPQDVGDAYIMNDGHLAMQVQAGGGAYEGLAQLWELNGPHGADLASQHRARALAPNADTPIRPDFRILPFGPLLMTLGGPPAQVMIHAAPTETVLAHTFASHAPLRHCAPYFDHSGISIFPISTIIFASDQGDLQVLALESNLSWTLPPPDDRAILGCTAVGDMLVVATEGGVWLGRFPYRMARDIEYRQLVSAEQYVMPGFDVRCVATIHRPHDDIGFAILQLQGVFDNRRSTNTILLSYDVRAAVVAIEMLPDAIASEWTAGEDGIAFRRVGGSSVHVEWDGESGALTVLPDDTMRRLRPRVRQHSFGWGRLSGLMEVEDPLFTSDGAASLTDVLVDGQVDFGPRSITVRRGDSVQQVWYEPAGYDLFDYDAWRKRAAIRSHDGRFQILDFDIREQDGPSSLSLVLGNRVRQTVDPSLVRLLRRCGQRRAAIDVITIWTTDFADAISPQVRPWLSLEEAQCRLAAGDATGAASIVMQLHQQASAIVADMPPATAEAWAADLLAQTISIVIFLRDRGNLKAIAEQHRDNLPYIAALAVDALLSLIQADAEIVAFVRDRCADVVGVLEEIDSDIVDQMRPGLDDIEMLIGVASSMLPPDPETTSSPDIETVNWHDIVGKEHHSMLDDALGGDDVACGNMGALFGSGAQVERNMHYAAWWYERSIASGNSISAFNLAQMIRHGEINDPDPSRPLKLMRFAAERGHTMAKTNLASLLLQGENAAENAPEARRWVEEAAAEGDRIAPLTLALMLVKGQGGPADPERARSMLLALASRGDVMAMQFMKELFGDSD